MDPLAVLKRNNVKTIGKGSKTILFAHGFGCDQNVWQFMVNAFTEEYKVVLFDYTGSGNSEKSWYDTDKYASINGYVQDVLDICKALELKNTIFIGHSVSSMVGVLAANKKPEYFEKLILIGPSPCYLNAENYEGGFEKEDLDTLFEFMESNYLGWSSAMAPAIMGNADRPELGTLLTGNFCATDPQVARDFAHVTFFSDNRTDLEKLTIKSLTLQCAEDILAPLFVGEFVHAHTPGNEIVFLEATGHCPHMSAPQETIRVIKTFLN